MARFLLIICSLPVYLTERHKFSFTSAETSVTLEADLCKHLHPQDAGKRLQGKIFLGPCAACGFSLETSANVSG